MAKHSYELKLSVVDYYLQNKGGYRFTSNKFQVEQSSVRKWIALFQLSINKSLSVGDIAKTIGVSRSTLYRIGLTTNVLEKILNTRKAS